MREIKFRFYRPSTNTMYFHINSFLHSIPLRLIYPKKGNFNDLIEEEDWKVMQYTGLKDKNGKEIFEGDVVKTNHAFLKTCKVEFIYGSFEFVSIYTDECIAHKNNTIVEVIGNIYENPELI